MGLSSASRAPALGREVDGGWWGWGRWSIFVLVEGVRGFAFGLVGFDSIKIETDILAKGRGGKKWR